MTNQFDYVVPQDTIKFFQKNGFATVENVIDRPTIDAYTSILKDMLAGKISIEDCRDDMNGHKERSNPELENCTQITNPNALSKELDGCEFFSKGKIICDQLYGVEKDFAMENCQFLVKHPETNIETPWHQDVN